jgi:hypothetical protein
MNKDIFRIRNRGCCTFAKESVRAPLPYLILIIIRTSELKFTRRRGCAAFALTMSEVKTVSSSLGTSGTVLEIGFEWI